MCVCMYIYTYVYIYALCIPASAELFLSPVRIKWFVKRTMKSHSESNDLQNTLWSPVRNQMICEMRFEMQWFNWLF